METFLSDTQPLFVLVLIPILVTSISGLVVTFSIAVIKERRLREILINIYPRLVEEKRSDGKLVSLSLNAWSYKHLNNVLETELDSTTNGFLRLKAIKRLDLNNILVAVEGIGNLKFRLEAPEETQNPFIKKQPVDIPETEKYLENLKNMISEFLDDLSPHDFL